MDKSKLAGIAVLVVLGGALFLSKANDAPAPGEDATEHSADDGHDHGADAKSADAPKTQAQPQGKIDEKADLVGGVKALKIEDQKVGTGATAKDGDNLSMNYKGMLLSGKIFDQSYGRAPFDFTLGTGQVIKGWDQGIKGMKVGGKRKLTIPSDLAYGPQGQPPTIPGGATLVFEVELLKAEAAPKPVDYAGGVTALKIQDIRPGTGAAAADGNKLTMDYKGMLLNGKVFDQSYGKQPFEFTLGQGQVIKGWDQGIKGMKVGGKRKLTIPASLGYGDAGAGADIPPGATLVFEVELRNVQK
jgi:peptidylprolyl isomerase